MPRDEGWARLESERDNLRAALAWLEQTGDRERLLRLAATLGGFWYYTGRLLEGRSWLERALATQPTPLSDVHGLAHFGLGGVNHYLGNDEEAVIHLEQSRAIARQHRDSVDDLEARSVAMLGIAEGGRGNYVAADALLAESLKLATTSDPTFDPVVIYHRGRMAYGRGDSVHAWLYWEQALATGRALDRPYFVCWCLSWLGLVATDRGDYAGAISAFREVLAMSSATEVGSLNTAGQYLSRGHMDAFTALLAQLIGEPERAARILGAWAAFDTREGGSSPSLALPERAPYERAERGAREALGQADFAHAWAEGRAMRPDQVTTELHAVLDAAEAWTEP
jgi:hypothetical protein